MVIERDYCCYCGNEKSYNHFRGICNNHILSSDNCIVCKWIRDGKTNNFDIYDIGRYWVLNHFGLDQYGLGETVGLGVGTIVITIKDHVTLFSDINENALIEMTNLMKQIYNIMMDILPKEIDSLHRIYINSWGSEQEHFHILLQPIYKSYFTRYGRMYLDNLKGMLKIKNNQKFRIQGPVLQAVLNGFEYTNTDKANEITQIIVQRIRNGGD